MDFSDQVAIVTGSSAGIGQTAAIGMAEGGAKLVINYAKNADAADKVVAACKAAGGDAIAVQADVSDDAKCKTLVETAMDKWGRLDILVNNAGTTKFMNHDDLEGLTAGDFEQIYALNLIGPYQMIKHARPHLAKSDAPSVVNISSVAGVRGIGSSIAYVASKGALNSTTLALARSWGRKISASMRYARLCRHGLVSQCLWRRSVRANCRRPTQQHANGTCRKPRYERADIVFCQSRQRPCDRSIACCRCGYAAGHAVQNWIGRHHECRTEKTSLRYY